MTSRRQVEKLLAAGADHGADPKDAAGRLADLPYRDLGFARVDTHRELRQGAPEVVLGSGKTPDQVARIALALAEAGGPRGRGGGRAPRACSSRAPRSRCARRFERCCPKRSRTNALARCGRSA